MITRQRLILIAILALSTALTILKVPLASSQGITLIAPEISGDLPLTDPDSTLWQQATALDIPLSAQSVTAPRLLNTNIKAITVRALHNGQQLAMLVEWTDPTRNDSLIRPQDFRDAVAVQFPVSNAQPFYCMGQTGGNVNIWQWKADWQADLTARQDEETAYPNMSVDYYPFATGSHPAPADYTDRNYVPALAAGNLFASQYQSPVENLSAGGFGTLTSLPVNLQDVQGHGVWVNGRWRVIFSRNLVTTDAVDEVIFRPGLTYGLAFAAWDGANNERNGQKSTSQWLALQLSHAPAAPTPAAQPVDMSQWYLLLTTMGLISLVIIVGGIWYLRRD